MILVLNAGSSSIKVELFDAALVSVLTGAVTEIGASGVLTLGDIRRSVEARDHEAALSLLLKGMEEALHQIQTNILPQSSAADSQLPSIFQAYHTQVERFCGTFRTKRGLATALAERGSLEKKKNYFS